MSVTGASRRAALRCGRDLDDSRARIPSITRYARRSSQRAFRSPPPCRPRSRRRARVQRGGAASRAKRWRVRFAGRDHLPRIAPAAGRRPVGKPLVRTRRPEAPYVSPDGTGTHRVRVGAKIGGTSFARWRSSWSRHDQRFAARRVPRAGAPRHWRTGAAGRSLHRRNPRSLDDGNRRSAAWRNGSTRGGANGDRALRRA
jgi:hypothetical protein